MNNRLFQTQALPDHFEASLIAKIDGKTKPIGALGRIETLAGHCARIQGSLSPRVESCNLAIFAADHGMAACGVSAYPQAVTRQMVINFLNGGAAANVFAQSVGASVQVIDAGVAGGPLSNDRLINRRVGNATANAIEGPAMSRNQMDQALRAGYELGSTVTTDVACFGEMGIGNSSSASLVAAKILGQPVEKLVGRGTGLDDQALASKKRLLNRAATRSPAQLDSEVALSEYGGFEIAMLAGAMMGAANQRRIVVVDGFIATSAALCARELAPGCEASFVFAHRSAEPGHTVMLADLKAEPLFDLEMRLGEGTGALLAYPLIKASADMLSDMASFDKASISGPV